MCQCNPTSNLACEFNSPFMFAQPTCQTLPDGTTSANPYYDVTTNMSYYTYKFYPVCTGGDLVPFLLAFSITNSIMQSELTVSEMIFSCGRFESIPYILSESDPGLQNLIITIDSRYTDGVAVIYRLEIVGEYVPTISDVLLLTNNIALFIFDAGYLVPRS